MTNNLNAAQSSEYGVYDGDSCDPMLRSRVLGALQLRQVSDLKQSSQPVISSEQILEVAKYISQLEDALLRYHWGAMEHHLIHEILKCSTGLDIEARASALAAMAASDA